MSWSLAVWYFFYFPSPSVSVKVNLLSDLSYSVPYLLLHNFCPLEQCNYKYPGPAMPEVKDCNLELPVPLELICQVDSTINDSFTIQWHYSDSSSPPSKNNSISMETILVRNNMIEIYNTSPQVSMLRLTNYSNNTEMASGHYWCTVQYQTLETLSNPSKVVNINICPFTGNKAEEQGMDGCAVQVNLVVMTNRCAEDAASIVIEKVQLGSNEMCAMEDLDQDVEESTTTDEAFPNHDQSTIMILPTSGFPMYNVWMIVGIAFGILITIIIVMLIAIIYLNHKKNKIRGM